jgi:hypothetical protein
MQPGEQEEITLMTDIDTMDIEELRDENLRGQIRAREAQQVVLTERATPLPFAVGDAILIRTVTMIQVGRVKAIGRDFFVLEDGGWLADTGRFSEMLEHGTFEEFERAPSWVLVGRGAVVDAFPWAHPLPKATR